jgi:glycine betaine/proline transport system ATP-binding protein
MSTAPAIELKGVWKVFGPRAGEALAAIRSERIDKDEALRRFGCVVAVADVSIAIAQGEIFCIMGLSGSGKSTLLRHVNRLVEPTAGEVLIHGENIGSMSAGELRGLRAKRIGMVFQHVALFPHRRIWENVAFGLEVRGVARPRRRQVAQETLERVQLSGWGDRYPGERSGGMQQRVGLARALAADPDVLLMDEPFSALDPLIRRQLQDQFLQLASVMKKTTLFITHDLDEAIRLGHRIAVMKDGHFIQTGTAEQIVLNPADSYVAEFVHGVSRLKIVRAHSLMRLLEPSELTRLCSTARVVDDSADLDQMIRIAAEAPGPLLVLDREKRPVGVISENALLRALYE